MNDFFSMLEKISKIICTLKSLFEDYGTNLKLVEYTQSLCQNVMIETSPLEMHLTKNKLHMKKKEVFSLGFPNQQALSQPSSKIYLNY